MRGYRCLPMQSPTSRRKARAAASGFLAAGFATLAFSGAFAQDASPPSLSLPAGGNAQPAPGKIVPPSMPTPVVPPPVAPAGDAAKQPADKVELQGAPFPSMVPGSTKQPPLSNRGMGLDTDSTRRDMDQLNSQTNQRLGEIKTGLGTPAQSGQVAPGASGSPATTALPAPNTSGYTSELQELSALQRSTRLMQARRQEAEAAMAVWSVLYDPRKEDEAAKQAKEAKDKEEQAAKEQAAAKERESAQPSRNGQPSSAAATDAAARMELPLPRIVSVLGTGGKLRATLLVPYVGEVSAVPGTPLPGDRRVMSVTNDGVTVHDPKMGNLALGYGDSVPLAPPSQQQTRPGLPGSPAGAPLFNVAVPPLPPVVQGR